MTVISSILQILKENSNVQITKSQKETTFNPYLTKILAIQSSLDETSRIREPEEALLDPIQPHKSGNTKHRKDGESESEEDEESSSKRPRLNESDMLWFSSSDKPTIASQNPSCRETCRLLQAYNQDVSKAKFFVKIASNSPAGFPSSQWEQILKGESVNLNQVFTSLHHVVLDEERAGHLGDSEISFGVTEAKKQVSTATEWSAAWRRASKAIIFAFPHRREELLDYGDYIEPEFTAKQSSVHHKIILYNVTL